MTSPASTARRAGFRLLLAASGEDLTFRTLTVRAIVNVVAPAPGTPDTDRGQRRDTVRTTSTIELLRSAVATPPDVGEEFLDAGGRRHRIAIRPRTTDLTHVCECVVSEPTE